MRKSKREKFAALRAVTWFILRKTGAPELYFRTLALFRYRLASFSGRRHSLPGELIVSLTSYPPRFAALHLTLYTLLSQDVRPDSVILWLYDGDVEALPDEVLRLVGDTFRIETISADLRSFKKLVPAVKAHPAAYIVTADDDFYYKRTWLGELAASHLVGAREVVGHRAHVITLDEHGAIRPYREWRWKIREHAAHPLVFLTSGGGMLFPPGSLVEEALDQAKFMNLCPTADDIWLYFMLRKGGVICRKVGDTAEGYSWRGAEMITLFEENLNQGMNDDAIERLVREFGNPITGWR